MPPSTDPSAFADSGRRRALLVTFSWGDPGAGFFAPGAAEGGVARYTTWSEALVLGAPGGGGERFEPLGPDRLDVDLPREDLSLEPDPFVVTAPRFVEPFRSVVRAAHPPIEVRVEEVDVDDRAVRRVRAWGTMLERDFTLGDAAPGAEGDRGALVKAPCATLRHSLKATLGLVASPICNWDPGRGECGVKPGAGGMSLDEITVPGVVTAIDGRVVTVDVLADFPALRLIVQPAGWARFGTLRRGALVIDILDHDQDGGRALLSAEPPASWLDATVGVTAGCPGTAAACTNRFNNIERFGGFGHAMTDYNPAFSGGPS